MEDYDKAISFQRKNLAYQLQHGKQTDKADAYFNIAGTKSCLRESDSAFYYYRVAEAIYQKENDLSSLSRVYLMTGYLYFDTGNHDLALAYEQQALRTSKITKGKLDMQGILFSIGSIYRAKGDNDSSRIYFKRALALSDEVKNADIEHEICKNLSEIYEKQDSLKLSHHYLLRCKKLKDSLLTPQKIHRINAIDFSEHRKQSSTQLLWWVIFLFFLFLLCALYLFRRRSPKLPVGAGQNHNELEAKLNHQQKELMTQTIRLQQQGELIERTKSELRGLELNDQNRTRVRTLLSELKSTQQSSNWSEFERHFNDVHLDFYKKLMTDYPQLTVNERRLCGFISLNLSNKEISEITRKSVRSIEVAKYRLGQKLEVPKEGSIKEILAKYL
jgi:tetratricopeptide (TPR) repeat protein